MAKFQYVEQIESAAGGYAGGCTVIDHWVRRRHADARSRSVLQETMEQRVEKVWILRICFQCRWGMGLSQITLPANRLASRKDATALGWSMVFVSERIRSVVAEFSTGGCIALSFVRALPRSVPLP